LASVAHAIFRISEYRRTPAPIMPRFIYPKIAAAGFSEI
jgi:hypothetical protein